MIKYILMGIFLTITSISSFALTPITDLSNVTNVGIVTNTNNEKYIYLFTQGNYNGSNEVVIKWDNSDPTVSATVFASIVKGVSEKKIGIKVARWQTAQNIQNAAAGGNPGQVQEALVYFFYNTQP